jgi:hypothetical protein
VANKTIKLPFGDTEIPVTVVSDEEAETVDYVVCVPAGTPSPFSDNLTAFCCRCGVKVIHRWHAPRKPKKICLECMVIIGEEEMARR